MQQKAFNIYVILLFHKEHNNFVKLSHNFLQIEPLLYVDVDMPSYGWRRLLGLSAVPYLAALLFYGLVPESPIIMPPRRFKKKSVRKIVEKRVAKAIEKYEKTRADSNNTGGSGSTNTRGTVVPEMHGCSYKTFMNGKPHSFKGTEDDKVKFAMCTFEGRALTWWNGNVHTLGLANANQSPGGKLKAIGNTEYCPEK
ncbi:hypothetical protein Tco_1228856 [Tanacetum coccineum]